MLFCCQAQHLFILKNFQILFFLYDYKTNLINISKVDFKYK